MKKLLSYLFFSSLLTAMPHLHAAELIPRLDFTTEVTDTLRNRSVKITEASTHDIFWTFTQDGIGMPLTNATQILFIYEDDAQTFSQTITGSVDSVTNAFIRFTPDNSNTNGTFRFALTIGDGTIVFARSIGELRLERQAGIGNTNAFPAGVTNINWLNFNYVNTASSGPYRAGTNVSFSSNADGSVNINVPTDTNLISSLTAGTNITITGTGTNRTISHSNTSDLVSIDNSNGIVIQDLTFDGHGHVTAEISTNLDLRFLQISSNLSDLASAATARTNISLVVGTDVLSQQTIGIADNNLLEVDGSPNSAEYARFTPNGLEGRTEAEFKADFNLEIGTDVQAFSTNLDTLALNNGVNLTNFNDSAIFDVTVFTNNGGVITKDNVAAGGVASGIDAWAEGRNTKAFGNQSHAEGSGSVASNTAAHAEGLNTTASGGEGSHSEGTATRASGNGSHAEGSTTLASGSTSHAQGNTTTASGSLGANSQGTLTIASLSSSHAEGGATMSLGNNSHSEGTLTIAYSASSHAEGLTSIATNTAAHAEGNLTIASGLQSHSEGNTTTASGTSSHSGGERSVAGQLAQFSRASGRFDTDADAQYSDLVARNQTTDAVQTELFLDGSGIRFLIGSGKTATFNVMVTAVQTGGAGGSVGDSAGYEITGVFKNVGGTSSLVAAVTKRILGEDDTDWDATVEADNGNDALVVKVTGDVSDNVNWVAKISVVEVL